MNIKNISLFTIISLCPALSHGMENNNFENSFVGMMHKFAKQQIRTLNKNLKKEERRQIDRSDIAQAKKLLDSDATITSEEKNRLHELLTQNNQVLKDCYSIGETWSSETDVCENHEREILISRLKPEINNEIIIKKY